MAVEKIKILGAVFELPAKQHCRFGPLCRMSNWQRCLAGSSNTAPRILISSMAMGAKPSFQLKFIYSYREGPLPLSLFSTYNAGAVCHYGQTTGGVQWHFALLYRCFYSIMFERRQILAPLKHYVLLLGGIYFNRYHDTTIRYQQVSLITTHSEPLKSSTLGANK